MYLRRHRKSGYFVLEDISSKLESILQRIRGEGRLTESNIQESMNEVRDALLEADVNFKVVKDFIKKVERKAIGQTVLKSVRPGQQVIKIVNDELKALMGHTNVQLKTAGIPPTVIMLCGLQGSGKTTFSGKLAKHFKDKGRLPMLVAADVYRPAAKEQLRVIAQQVGVPAFISDSNDAVKICEAAIKASRDKGCDTIILDTAGRLAIDDDLMKELQAIKKKIKVHEILFVADGMLGQDAVNTAKEFANKITFDGVVLTKMDGDTRGGAALSIRAIVGKPIKFISSGEKMGDLEPFHPERIASRILGMGDVLTFVERAQQNIDAESAAKMQKKMMKNQFTLQDFLDQIRQIKKMGPLEDLMKMIPGMSAQMKNIPVDNSAFVRTEAIINSMTKTERNKPVIINGSRRKRIAMGSGTRVQDVNQLLNQFEQMKKLMKKMGGNKLAGLMPKSLNPLNIGR